MYVPGFICIRIRIKTCQLCLELRPFLDFGSNEKNAGNVTPISPCWFREMNTQIRFETLNTENFKISPSKWVKIIEGNKESWIIKMSGLEERKAKRRRHKGSSVVKTSNQTCQSFPGSLGFDLSSPAPTEILSPSLDSEVVILHSWTLCIFCSESVNCVQLFIGYLERKCPSFALLVFFSLSLHIICFLFLYLN